MNDPKLKDCPQEECKGEVRRLLGTGAGLIFKGSGFYQTDYRSDSYKAGEKKESSSASTSSGGDSGGSSAPAAPKTEAAKPRSTGGNS